MMASIKGKNTKPELLLRKALHKKGFRYKLHSSELPGKPDILLKSYNAAIFVNGCFWHGHDCRYFKWPTSRSSFWKTKIEENRARDMKVHFKLRRTGWRQLVVWECALRSKDAKAIDRVAEKVARWLTSNRLSGVIKEL
jgi:DNA mismatch endonuclease (patch repair protein)